MAQQIVEVAIIGTGFGGQSTANDEKEKEKKRDHRRVLPLHFICPVT